jgi:hypothetical protein
MANPRGQQRDKPYRDALRMEITAAGEDHRALRAIARAHIAKAKEGDMHAIRELADRLDGKVAQPIKGDDEDRTPVGLRVYWPGMPVKSDDDTS